MNYCRSEIHVPSVSLRFILILEAYCRGNIWHIKLLTRQVKPRADVNPFKTFFLATLICRLCPLALSVQNEALLKMMTLSDIVKSGAQKMTVDGLKTCIGHESFLEPLSNLLSPLNPSVILSEIWLVPDARTYARTRMLLCSSLLSFLSLLNHRMINRHVMVCKSSILLL